MKIPIFFILLLALFLGIPSMGSEMCLDFYKLTAAQFQEANFYAESVADKFDAGDFYNQSADSYHNKFKNRSDDDFYIAKFMKQTGSARSSRILEAGCGDGRHIDTILSVKPQARIMGIDISSAMLAYAETMHPLVPFYQMDIRNLKFQNNSFEQIIAMYSLIHLKTPEIVLSLREFRRVLSANGRILLSFQKGNDQEIKIESPITGQSLSVNAVSEHMITRLLSLAGFQIESIEYRNHVEGVELPLTKMYVSARVVK